MTTAVQQKIRAIVADDSSIMRLIISDILNSDDNIEVVDTAKDGLEACQKTKLLEPDVLVLDMTMGRYDGLYAVRNVMKEHPTPIVILSALGNTNLDPIINALELGAVDYLNKPDSRISSQVRNVDKELIRKVKAAVHANFNVYSKKPVINTNIHTFGDHVNYDAIIIGSSTGGPGAVDNIVSRLPSNLAVPVILIQHIPENFVQPFVDRLNELTPLQVVIGRQDMPVEPGKIYVAPGDKNMIVKKSGLTKVRLDYTDVIYKEYNYPSVNAMMLSAAEVYGARAIGVILTGMGKDGADGLRAIKENGGFTIAQSEETCVVFGMPKAAIDARGVCRVVPLYEIAGFLVSCLA